MTQRRQIPSVALLDTLSALVLLAVVLVVGWLVVRRPTAPDGDPAAPARPADAPPPTVGRAPPLAAPPARAPALPAQRLEIEVVGPDDAPVPDATVVVHAVLERVVGDAPPAHQVVTGGDGRAAVDLASAAARPGARGVSVDVEARAATRWSSRETVDFPLGGDGRPAPAFVLSRRVRLEDARVLEGTVADPAGRPVAASVWVVDADPDGDFADAESLSTSEGAYQVWLRSLQPLDVVAFAAGFAPARVRAHGGRTGRERLPPLVLTPGVAIEGRLVGAASQTTGQVVVAAACGAWAADERQRTVHGAVAVTSTPERCFVTTTAATSGPDGTFRVTGLGATPYRVRAAVDDFGCALHPDAEDACTRIVTPPAADVVLDVGTARLQVQALDGTTPIPNALVTVEGASGRLVLFAGRDAIAGAAVLAGRRYRVHVEAAGRAPVQRDVVAPDAGATHVERVAMDPRTDDGASHFLPPWVARPASLLRLRVVAPDGAPALARLRLTGPDGQEVALRLAAGSGVACSEREGRAPAGGYAVLLTPVRPGRHTLHVLDGAWEPATTTFDVRGWEPGDVEQGVTVTLHAR